MPGGSQEQELLSPRIGENYITVPVLQCGWIQWLATSILTAKAKPGSLKG